MPHTCMQYVCTYITPHLSHITTHLSHITTHHTTPHHTSHYLHYTTPTTHHSTPYLSHTHTTPHITLPTSHHTCLQTLTEHHPHHSSHVHHILPQNSVPVQPTTITPHSMHRPYMPLLHSIPVAVIVSSLDESVCLLTQCLHSPVVWLAGHLKLFVFLQQ